MLGSRVGHPVGITRALAATVGLNTQARKQTVGMASCHRADLASVRARHCSRRFPLVTSERKGIARSDHFEYSHSHMSSGFD
jgi:hypothetical protein